MCILNGRRLLVSFFLVALVVVVAYALVNAKSVDEMNSVIASNAQGEGLPPSVINRKPPNAPHCKILEAPTVERYVASPIESKEKMNLRMIVKQVGPGTSPAELASEKNQIMDKLLNQPQMPSDYGDIMVELYRDKSQDVLTRDFAVQHIGLYAQALARRGEYDADAAESRKLRAALFDAAGETRTIVAAAAFRALADMSEFDQRVDANHLDSLLAACAAESSADPASRSIAVQLCGECRVRSSRPALESIRSDSTAPEILRRSANYSLALIAGTESSRRSQTRADLW